MNAFVCMHMHCIICVNVLMSVCVCAYACEYVCAHYNLASMQGACDDKQDVTSPWRDSLIVNFLRLTVVLGQPPSYVSSHTHRHTHTVRVPVEKHTDV